MYTRQNLGGPSFSSNEFFPCSSLCSDGLEIHRLQQSKCHFMYGYLWLYFHCFGWIYHELVFQKEITDSGLCNPALYHFLTDAFNFLYAKLVLLQSFLEVFQMSLLVKKILYSFFFRSFTSIMCCKNFFIKIHTPLQNFPNPIGQSCSNLAIEI